MEITKTIVNNLLNVFFEKILGQIELIAKVLYAIFYFWLMKIEAVTKNHMEIFFPIFLFLLASTVFLYLKIYFSTKKKLINRIKVDKNGECYCPRCAEHLNIIKPSTIGQTVFSCKKCDDTYRPALENGKSVVATEFYAFQREHPQKELTSIIYNKWTLDYCKKNAVSCHEQSG